jgi:hypothetical protein
MARAGLRDDWNAPPTNYKDRVRLDSEDPDVVTAAYGDWPVPPLSGGTEGPGGSVNPTVTVRERVHAGYDDDGNSMWDWVPVVTDAEAIVWEQRTETSERANTAKVVGDFTILYPAAYASVRESAVVEALGKQWRVTSVERFPDRIQLVTERIDDGA